MLVLHRRPVKLISAPRRARHCIGQWWQHQMSVHKLRHYGPKWVVLKSRGLFAGVSFLSSRPPPRYLTCAIFRAVFDDRSLFFAPKPHRHACYAGYRILHHHDLLSPLYSSSSSFWSFSSSFFFLFSFFFFACLFLSIWLLFFPTPIDKQSIVTKVRARSFKAWWHFHSKCHTSCMCLDVPHLFSLLLALLRSVRNY